jgi:hypothetical protein
MFRRATLGLSPAILALAFVFAVPAVSAGSSRPGATTTASSADVGARLPVIRGSLSQEIPDVAYNKRADEDDTPDDGIIRVVTAVVWPHAALKGRFLRTAGALSPTHRPCAGPPRAPPTA